jgi:uncharacterized membrane protein YkvA (DUF1232 family)
VTGLRARAQRLRRDALAVRLLARDPRVPWYVKALALAVAAYAFSPIDLIPDFVPVLGLLDDLLLVPLGIWAVVRLVPPPLLAEHRAAASVLAEKPASLAGAALAIAAWAGILIVAGFYLLA